MQATAPQVLVEDWATLESTKETGKMVTDSYSQVVGNSLMGH